MMKEKPQFIIVVVLLLSLLSPLASKGQGHQNIREESQWNYALDYAWFIQKWNGNVRYGELFNVIGKKEKNGKTYFTLQFVRSSDETDVGSSGNCFHDDDEVYMFNIILLKKGESQNQINIREENGRFLVDREEYLSVLNDESYGGKVGNPDYIPYEITDDKELILYDFTKRKGDIYCYSQKGEPIMVVAVESIETEDKILRKMITLSNNMTIIEGIGCINSSGTFLYYLNPGKRNHQTACLVYNMYKHKPGDYDWILWQKDYKEILISISTGISKVNENNENTNANSLLFDLQGRRINGEPKRGLYIRDGKKVIK